MKIYIDFSIFDSPTSAFGNITGELDLAEIPVVGSKVTFEHNGLLCLSPHFMGSLRIISVQSGKDIDGNEMPSVGLEDVVVSSRVEAADLANKLNRELGLFIDISDE
jgi:hypothetical protein